MRAGSITFGKLDHTAGLQVNKPASSSRCRCTRCFYDPITGVASQAAFPWLILYKKNELPRLLHGQIGRWRPFEEPIRIVGGAVPLADLTSGNPATPLAEYFD